VTIIKRISISNVQDILSIIGEEDSIGLDKDTTVQRAITMLQNKIEAKINAGELHEHDILLTYE